MTLPAYRDGLPLHNVAGTLPTWECGGECGGPCSASAVVDLNDPCRIQYTGAATPPPGETVASWHWTFDDAGTSSVQNPLYTHGSFGPHSAVLLVTFSDNTTCTASSGATCVPPCSICPQSFNSEWILVVPGAGSGIEESDCDGVCSAISGVKMLAGGGCFANMGESLGECDPCGIASPVTVAYTANVFEFGGSLFTSARIVGSTLCTDEAPGINFKGVYASAALSSGCYATHALTRDTGLGQVDDSMCTLPSSVSLTIPQP